MDARLYELKNIEMNRSLRRVLRTSRQEGLSYRKIAELLSAKGTPVGRTVVETWCKSLGLK
jgi:transposase